MASNLPDYVASAQPVPLGNRVAWYKSTAQTYAGIMLWFVFWQDVPTGGGLPGGALAQGVLIALGGLILAALLCHFLYYLVPGMMGLQSGLPLYIVGTSTYGVTGGLFMPGLLMGLLQFGWLGVNACFSAAFLVAPFYPELTLMQVISTPPHIVVTILWAVAAAFMGLKGIQYVASVATFFPLIPLAILIILFAASAGGLANFNPEALVAAAQAEAPPVNGPGVPLSMIGVIALMLTYIIGFFATAGAAGVDFGMNNRDSRDVQLGGLVGIAGATIFAGGMALLIVAGTHGGAAGASPLRMNPAELMPVLVGARTGGVFMYLLAIAAFPPACFSAFIAANSFKTTLPQFNPFVTVGAGTLVSILLAATGIAAQVIDVFQVIGASFGPVCGAMVADYLLAGKRWAGPRAGFNMAGWISWVVGFLVGAFNLIASNIPGMEQYGTLVPVPPLSAFIVGFVLYLILAKGGLESEPIAVPQVEKVKV